MSSFFRCHLWQAQEPWCEWAEAQAKPPGYRRGACWSTCWQGPSNPRLILGWSGFHLQILRGTCCHNFSKYFTWVNIKIYFTFRSSASIPSTRPSDVTLRSTGSALLCRSTENSVASPVPARSTVASERVSVIRRQSEVHAEATGAHAKCSNSAESDKLFCLFCNNETRSFIKLIYPTGIDFYFQVKIVKKISQSVLSKSMRSLWSNVFSVLHIGLAIPSLEISQQTDFRMRLSLAHVPVQLSKSVSSLPVRHPVDAVW